MWLEYKLMNRIALKQLQLWKTSSNRTPLLIRGARQVGKTWLVREAGKFFPSFVEINLEADPEYREPFKDFFGKPKELLSTLELMLGRKIVAGETLLFLDEIQYSKEALLALRYFKEKIPLLHVIACGSLLEFTIKELSFPVGRIDFFYLFPLSFEEYLLARQREDLAEAIDHADVGRPIPKAVHDLLLEEVGIYTLIGGMPEVVGAYVQTKDIDECAKIQQRLIGTFREDFYKYAARAKVENLRRVFEGIPRLLGQKFKYARIDPEMRPRETAPALQLLVEAGLVYKTFHTSAHGVPLGSQIRETKFKAFFLDVGLAIKLLGLNYAQLFLERKTLLSNRGAIAEQFVAQELLAHTPQNDQPQLYYWHREAKSSTAEVDFILAKGDLIIPIEVKSALGSKTKSLNLFVRERKEIAYALKFSMENFSQKERLKTIPFYAVGKIF